MSIKVLRIAAGTDGDTGGNPAGVVLADAFPEDTRMQRTAAAVGFSETAFAVRVGDGWRVRYFSPECEVPFCGHATIALGAALASEEGDGTFRLVLNDATITVDGRRDGSHFLAAFQSPRTRSAAAPPYLVQDALQLLGYLPDDLDPRVPPALASAGATHLIIGLGTRQKLAEMIYELSAGRKLMLHHGLVTIVLAFAESPQLFHTRNPFASGGLYEDSATGAGTSALAGYLRDIGWPHGGTINVVQGEDMGQRSLMRAEMSREKGSSIRVSGTARMMAD